MDTTGDMIENVDPSNRFLFRPKVRADGQQFAYSVPPTPKSVHSQPSLSTDTAGSDKCNPSGYFRVQRLYTPESQYTEGSKPSKPENRCRPRSDKSLSKDVKTESYIDDFTGPDYFRAVIDGPEHYIANQQINLGDCTYAIPYVLSRPGRFWLIEIEHVYEDYAPMNENYDGKFFPVRVSKNILAVVPPTAPGSDAGFYDHKEYKKMIAQIYQFTVCSGCPQLLQPATQTKYEDWPECSIEPIKGAREYGVYSRRYPVQDFEDLAKQQFEWVGARPSCRHGPRLMSFEIPETVQPLIGEGNSTVRAYGAPPTAPATMEQFEVEHAQTMACFKRERKIWFAGDSHLRLLLSAVQLRFLGDRSDTADFQGSEPHTAQLGGIFIQQDYDQWLQRVVPTAKYMTDPGYVPFSFDPNGSAMLEKYDTLVLDHGAWNAAAFGAGPLWETVRYVDFMREVLSNLAQIKQDRRAFFKKTGLGFDDLNILWVGQTPSGDIINNNPDMRSNPRLQYWDDLISQEIAVINDKYKEMGGAINHLDVYPKIMPHRRNSIDGSHHPGKKPMDAIVQVLVSKLDFCRPAFTPKFPPPPTDPNA
ncbi:hypothetical protein BGZ83_006472 [Gryganskiella cystojenkinii]|nr:hypothetical protein BGZ83_006472 [Gryganskiella cystojenkinii]